MIGQIICSCVLKVGLSNLLTAFRPTAVNMTFIRMKVFEVTSRLGENIMISAAPSRKVDF